MILPEENNEQVTKAREPLTFDIFSKYRNELFGISIILIMMFHFFHAVIKYTPMGGRKYYISYIFCQAISSVGVEVFMFLSGMGLYFSFTKNKDTGAFFRKRFVRILVPYAIYGTIAWFITDMVVADKPFTRYLYDLSLFNFWVSGETRLWFISAIIVFYILFPLLYEVVVSKHYVINTGLLTAFLIIAMYVSNVEKHKYFKLTEIAVTRLPIFIFGILIGRLVFEKAKIKPFHIAIAAAAVALRIFSAVIGVKGKYGTLPEGLKTVNAHLSSILGNRLESSVFSVGFMAVCLVLLMLIKWKWLHGFLKAAGGMSLELYMAHVTVNGIIRTEGTLDICQPHIYLLSMVISVSAAVLLHIVSGAVISKINAPKAAPSAT